MYVFFLLVYLAKEFMLSRISLSIYLRKMCPANYRWESLFTTEGLFKEGFRKN